MALRVLINATLADTARKLGITEERVKGILDRHVETEVNWDEYAHLGLIGIDEVALREGHRDYVAIVTTQLEGGGIGCLGCWRIGRRRSRRFWRRFPSRCGARSGGLHG